MGSDCLMGAVLFGVMMFCNQIKAVFAQCACTNANKLFIFKWLTSCYVNFTSTRKKFLKQKKQSYHYTTIRMAQNKKTDHSNYWRGY